MPGAANDPRANSADPTGQMPPGLHGVVRRRWKIPKGAKPANTIAAAISCNESGRHGPGGGPRYPVKWKRSPENDIDTSMIGRQSKTPGEHHGNGSPGEFSISKNSLKEKAIARSVQSGYGLVRSIGKGPAVS